MPAQITCKPPAASVVPVTAQRLSPDHAAIPSFHKSQEEGSTVPQTPQETTHKTRTLTCKPPVAPVMPIAAQGLGPDHAVCQAVFQSCIPGLSILLSGGSFCLGRLSSLSLHV